MPDSRPRMPNQEPEGFEMIDGIEYNATPDRSLSKPSPEDRGLWLAMVDDMERRMNERAAQLHSD